MDQLKQLGPYRIEALLGSGGMGKVYRATDTRLHRTVAIKVLPDDKVSDPDRQRRFLQEARAASALNHPNIVTLHDIASDGGVDYLVMEYVSGTPFDKLIVPKGLPLPELLSYATQIATALAAAHAAGIVYRDLKPANIILAGPESSHPGQVKILDFGLAKLEERAVGPHDRTHTLEARLTRPGAVMGTLAYMSPEQARAEDVDARTDLFSFGAVLYELASGHRAFPKALDWTTPPAGPLPPELRQITLKLLEVEPRLRYQSASDLAADLQRLKRDRNAPPAPLHWKWIAIAAATIALSAFAYFKLQSHAPLTDKDTIVLADFKNSTGDAVFDSILRQRLSVELEQSPFLKLISDKRIHEELTLMGQPPNAPITPERAHDICIRTDSAAVVAGSIDKLGSQYVLALSAKSCRSEAAVADIQVQVAAKEDVLKGLGQIAAQFRAKAGESLVTVQKLQSAPQPGTTASLEAWQAYNTGWRLLQAANFVGAIPLLKHATELDPNFAMAYATLGRAYLDLRQSSLAFEQLTKAYELRDRASQSERLFIILNYHREVTGDLEKARETAELWSQTYPRDPRPVGFLSSVYQMLGQSRKAADEGNRAIDIDPTFVFGYNNLAWAYLQLSQLDQAEKTLDIAAARKVYISEFTNIRFSIAFLKRDQNAMSKIAAAAVGKPDEEDYLCAQEAAALAYCGRLRQARVKTKHAVELNQSPAEFERSAAYAAGAAIREALFGNKREARTHAAQARKLSNDREPLYGAAVALLIAGDTVEPQAIANDLAERFKQDTQVKYLYLPTIRALIALPRDPAKALELLQTAAPYDLAVQGSGLGSFGNLYTAYVRGLAFNAMHQGTEAAAEFQKILDHPGLVALDPIGAIVRVELAKAYALSGDRAKAGAAYQDFLKLWIDADLDIPLLLQAKAEFSALQ